MKGTTISLSDQSAAVLGDWHLRDSQRILLDQLDEERPRLALLEAPTGIGKSLLAMTYGELLGVRTAVLTATISLQHQYERDFDVTVMKGRANYPCLDNEMTAAEGTCQVKKDFRCESPYYEMRQACRGARRLVSNYALYMNELYYGRPPWVTKEDATIDLLVCDEGHRMLDLLTDFEVMRLDAKLTTKLGIRNDGGWGSLLDAQEWAEDNKDEIAELRLMAILDRRKTARDWTALHRQVAAMAEVSPNLITLKTGEVVEGSPLWPHHAAERLFRSAKKVLVMSATLYGGDELAELLGYHLLEGVDLKFYTTPSPFPAHRWPVYFRPAGYPSHKNPSEWDKIALAVHEYVHTRTEEKGVIHVSAKNQVERVLAGVRACGDCTQRVIAPAVQRNGAAESRADLLTRFRNEDAGTWLCHYSVGEGEDFKDDTARIQLIAKVPYPDLGDKLTKLRSEEPGVGRRMYAAMTAAKIAQMAGRGMRHEGDYCETIILDGNFGRLWKWNQDVFPAWFGPILQFGG